MYIEIRVDADGKVKHKNGCNFPVTLLSLVINFDLTCAC